MPIKGQKGNTLHLINEELALRYLPNTRIQRFRLALATKPHDNFFLCHVPSDNLDNLWNQDNLDACEKAKTAWVIAISKRKEGGEGYRTSFAQDPDFAPQPNWPPQSIDELIHKTFADYMIQTADHPGLLRLIGAKPKLS